MVYIKSYKKNTNQCLARRLIIKVYLSSKIVKVVKAIIKKYF